MDLIGKTLGGYQIVEQIGQGGMASIFKAYQPSLDREVAIKVLPPFYAEQNDSFLARFKREAKSVAKLRHPNILMVMDFGEQDDIAYIIMEYVKAGTLKDMMTRPMALSEIYPVIKQIAGALDYAHGEGVIHRDIKPSNILMPKPDWALLTDFGLARMVEGSSVLTQSGMAMGTPAYMSPEQGSGDKVDARSDVYSLGIMLYEMTVGEVPYTADTPMAVMIKHIVDPLPIPSSKNPTIPESLERVILKVIAKNPDDRYQSAGELVKAIEAVADISPAWTPGTLVSENAEKSTLVEPAAEEHEPSQTAGDRPALVPGSEVQTKIKKKRARWPWIAAGIAGLGLAGLAVVAGGTILLRNNAAEPKPKPGIEQPAPQGQGLPPAQQDGPLQRGEELLAGGQVEQALAEFERALQQNPNSYARLLQIAERREQAGHYQEALAILELGTSYLENPDLGTMLGMGWMYNAVEDYPSAIEIFNTIISIDPFFDGEVYIGLGDAYAYAGDVAEGVQNFERLRELHPGYAPILIELAGLYLEQGKDRLAADTIRQAVELEPQNPWTHLQAAEIFYIFGENQHALDSVSRALQIGTEDVWFYEKAGWILKDLEKYQSAVDAFERALQLDQKNPWALIGLSGALHQLENRDHEIPPNLDRALKIAGEDIEIMNAAALIFAEIGRCERAVELFEIVLEINPGYSEAQAGLEKCAK